MTLSFAPLQPNDLAQIIAQQSQRTWLGLSGDCGFEEAAHLAGQPVAWCARAHDGGQQRILACFGINETFPGTQGVAWALLAEGLGRHHLPLTRFIRQQIAECGLARLELLAKCADIEPAMAEEPALGRDAQIAVVTSRALRTPEVRWAQQLGMVPAYVMRKVGFEQETFLAFERIG